MRRLLLLASMLSLLLVSGAQTAQATAGPSTFQWEVGAGTICDLGGVCPNIAMASNGDTIAVRALGNLDAEEREASGGGTFEHRTSSGALVSSGTLRAKRLLAFTFYGCAGPGDGFPSNFCGGRATLLVRLVGHPASNPSATVKANGILVVTCLFGSPPAGAEEGFTLDVKHLINFNESVRGDTLFILTTED